MKKIFRMILAAVMMLSLVACNKPKPAPDPETDDGVLRVKDLKCIHELEFGGVYVEITIEDFDALGFLYGDSLNVAFSNGYKLEDIPYYNGYYTANGQPLVVAYPGYDYVKVCINNGDDLWKIAGLDEKCTAELSLAEGGKYLDIQMARDIHYKDDRSLFDSDVQFANFRSCNVGDLKENLIYRSASPCDNQHNRAPYVDKLIHEAGVQYIINLADTEQKITNYISKDDFNSPYFKGLYDSGKVILLGLNMNYGSLEFKQKVVRGLTSMLENDGPYLIHCTEGKDRTEFVCMLLEALGNASYQEIVDDYMITYYNYYWITRESVNLTATNKTKLFMEQVHSGKYDTLITELLVPMIKEVVGDPAVDITTAELQSYAENFLKTGGMSDEQIQQLKQKLTR